MNATVQAKSGSDAQSDAVEDSLVAIRDACDALHSATTQTVDAMNEVLNVAVVCQQVLHTSVQLSVLARDTTTASTVLDQAAEALHADAQQGLAAIRRVSTHARELITSLNQAQASIVACARRLSDEATELQHRRDCLVAERTANARFAAKVASHARNITSLLDGDWSSERQGTQ